MAFQKDTGGEKNLTALGVFISDNYLAFIYKKMEKLSTAVYLVTNHFSEEEPLRFELRGRVVDLLGDIMSLNHAAGTSRTKLLEMIPTGIFETVSLLEIARAADMLSEANFSLLKDEYRKLMELLVSKYRLSNSSASALALSSDFFRISDDGVLRDTSESIQESASREIRAAAEFSTADLSDKRQEMSFMKRTPSTSPVPIASEKQTSPRQGEIIKMLRKKGELTVKDLAGVITGVSDKTLQRELAALAGRGVIGKRGKKRWSRYYLL
jgi:hypothetical protein